MPKGQLNDRIYGKIVIVDKDSKELSSCDFSVGGESLYSDKIVLSVLEDAFHVALDNSKK